MHHYFCFDVIKFVCDRKQNLNITLFQGSFDVIELSTDLKPNIIQFQESFDANNFASDRKLHIIARVVADEENEQ